MGETYQRLKQITEALNCEQLLTAKAIDGSLDAALKWVEEVLPRWRWKIEPREDDCLVTLIDPDELALPWRLKCGKAKKPELALVAAALRALHEQEKDDD